MSKFLACLLCLMLLASACEKDAPLTVGGSKEEDTIVEEPLVEEDTIVEEPLVPEHTFESSRETTVVTGSSELEDDTGYGFAYNPSNVLDLDYSTSWCPKDEGVPQVLTLSFPEPTELGTIGIVGGYARDEKIFFQNNRLKTVEVWYDDLPEAMDELHFEDSYGMQFFDLTQAEAQTVKFKIMETYPGSKYDDTCVAEVDLWSDYVKDQDEEAAYEYYLDTKEAFAKRPVGIADLAMVFADDYFDVSPEDVTYDCGAIDYTKLTKWMHPDGGFTYYLGEASFGSYSTDNTQWDGYFGMQSILSAKLNEWAEEGDEFEVKWIQDGSVMKLDGPRLVHKETIKAQTCSNGSLYISDLYVGDNNNGTGGFTVEIYYQGHLIGRTRLSLVQ